ncbi:hypothetical protein BH10CYA1_BH10CYA1_43100 [soil metagenome]
MTQSEVNQTLIESVIPVPFDLEQEIREKHQIIAHILKIAAGAALFNVLIIIACGIVFGPLLAGKLVVIEVMLGLSAVCLGIVVGHGKIMGLLTHAEEVAYMAREQVFVDLNMAREELIRLRHKLRRDTDPEGYGHVNELLKMVSPLVMMFVQKEKNIFRWGMFAWKIAQNAMAVMKQRSSKES